MTYLSLKIYIYINHLANERDIFNEVNIFNGSRLGVMVWDNEGLVIAAMATRVPQFLQAIEIEALAANKALEFAQEMGLFDIVLEGDSSLVMAALNSMDPGLAPYGLLLQDTLSLSLVFSKLSYSHTKREGNTVAHNLAHLTVNLPNCVIWMKDISSNVLSFYQADLAGISSLNAFLCGF